MGQTLCPETEAPKPESKKQADGKGDDAICKVGEHLKSPADVNAFPVWPDSSKSHVKKNLTRELWDELKDKKDPKSGQTFQEAIYQSCKWTYSGVGMKMGSHQAFTTFGPLCDKIIETYHGHQPGAEHISDMDYKQLKCPPFSSDESPRIISTRIRIGRSLAGFALCPSIDKQKRLEVEKLLTQGLLGLHDDLKGKYFSLTTMTDEEKNQLIEDHFLFKGGDPLQEAAGAERDWPEARGIYHNDAKTFLCWINEEDHLRIIAMEQGSDIAGVFSRLSRGAAAIEKFAEFSHDPHLGFITSCPTNLGTGMRASVHVKLPRLGKKKLEMQAIADRYKVQIRGAHGEHSETDDGVFDISNIRRLGFSEVELIQDMYDGVKAMIAEEMALENFVSV